jgi:hypothetical protein
VPGVKMPPNSPLKAARRPSRPVIVVSGVMSTESSV